MNLYLSIFESKIVDDLCIIIRLSLWAVKGPGLFKVIVEKMGLEPRIAGTRILVIGDGKFDMEARKAIGAKTAGFTRRATEEELLAAGADFTFNNFSDLSTYFLE